MAIQSEQISIKEVFLRVKSRKWTVAKVITITFIIACGIIIPAPRYYKSSIELAPELGNINTTKSSLSDIASSMGFNMNGSLLSDAISPELYPELLRSNNFIINLVNCKVNTSDGTINTTYYDYLLKYQKDNPITLPFAIVKNMFKKKESVNLRSKTINPVQLTKTEDEIFEFIRNNIHCSIDKKTNLISITVTDQDPLVAATMADAVRQQLQYFITRYRTNKARKDVEYYKKLTIESKRIYEKARQLYGNYSDANFDVMLESYRSKREDLENDMQLKFNTYSSLNNQLQAAKAKVQERTPAFTIVKSASVPLTPAGPKRMLFILGAVLIVFSITVIYISRDLIF